MRDTADYIQQCSRFARIPTVVIPFFALTSSLALADSRHRETNSKLRLRRVLIDALNFDIAVLVRRIVFLIASVIGTQVLMVEAARSDTLLTLGPWSSTLNGQLVDYSCLNTGFCNPTDTQATNLLLTGSKLGLSGGVAEGKVTLGPTGGVSVTAEGSEYVNAGVVGSLSYYLYVLAPSGSASPVPVGAYTSISTSVTTSASGIAGAYAEARFEVNGTIIDRTNGGGFNGVVPLFLSVNTEYQVSLSAGASGYQGYYCNPSCVAGSSGGASVDPFFFIDPSLDPNFTGNPSDYRIVLSDGIGNNLSTTPLPAAFSLFATGLAGLGLLGWRRKRTAHAAV